MNLSLQGAALALISSLPSVNGGTLVLYSGSQPASPETAVTGGNVALASFTFSNPAFGSPTSGSGQYSYSANFVSTSATPSTTGTAAFARATIVPSGAWVATTAYALGTIVSQTGNAYICCKAGTSASSGGPGSQVGQGFTDGTVGWNYIAGTSRIYADFSVGVGSGSDVVLGNLSLSPTTPVQISSFVIEMAAV